MYEYKITQKLIYVRNFSLSVFLCATIVRTVLEFKNYIESRDVYEVTFTYLPFGLIGTFMISLYKMIIELEIIPLLAYGFIIYIIYLTGKFILDIFPEANEDKQN